MPPPLTLELLAGRWNDARSAERANFQSYLIELCEPLGVERPRPAGSGYEFELPVRIVNRDGTEAQNFVGLYKKEGHFVLEAKDPRTAARRTCCSARRSARPAHTRPTCRRVSRRRT